MKSLTFKFSLYKDIYLLELLNRVYCSEIITKNLPINTLKERKVVGVKRKFISYILIEEW